MKTKIEIKSIWGSILFSYECEENTVKKTLLEGIKSNSDLRGSDLSNSENKEFAYLPIFCKWSNSIIGDKIQIGCKQKTIEEWEDWFNSDETFETERGTDDFKQIQAVFESYKAYMNFLNK